METLEPIKKSDVESWDAIDKCRQRLGLSRARFSRLADLSDGTIRKGKLAGHKPRPKHQKWCQVCLEARRIVLLGEVNDG